MALLGHFLLAEDEPEAERPYALRATRLGLPFTLKPRRLGRVVLPKEVPGGESVALAAAIGAGRAAMIEGGGESRLVIAPDEGEMESLAASLERMPLLRERLVVSTPEAIRRLLFSAGSRRLLDDALSRLERRDASLSARLLLSRTQFWVCAGLGLALLFAVATEGLTALAPLDVAAGTLFLALILMRMLALSLVLDHTVNPPPALPTPDPARLPVYTVLIPLYDEAHMVPELVRAMNRLDWPRDRLDIKFLIEARDRGTARALKRQKLRPPFEVVVVPDAAPRTKPKALAFALPLVRGEFITVYDAEDRPDPGQLIEAHAAFLAGGERLACVQAPLLIDNGETNGLAGLFAMEYAILFDALLPFLAALDLPLPLGGTSNHFRRAALEAVGGWDPYNVTEDADLGIRLARFGYRARTITRPTYEEAPLTTRLWLNQRTRWLKGWMQTFLVHMRHPLRLWHEIGTRRLAGFLLTSLGSVVAAAVYPIYLTTALFLLFDPALLWRAHSPLVAGMIMLNLFNFIAAYFVFGLLATMTFHMRRSRRPAGPLIFLPAYWLLLSIACYRALIQLILAPHHWAKTPHLGRRAREEKHQAHRPVRPGGAIEAPVEGAPPG